MFEKYDKFEVRDLVSDFERCAAFNSRRILDYHDQILSLSTIWVADTSNFKNIAISLFVYFFSLFVKF